MATFAVGDVEIFGGVLKAEGVVVDKDNNVYGGGRTEFSTRLIQRARWRNYALYLRDRFQMASRWIATATLSIAI